MTISLVLRHAAALAVVTVVTTASAAPRRADPLPPSIVYGPLYRAVELAGVFPDSKTFPDLVPREPPDAILRAYGAARHHADFDLPRFVARYFRGPAPPGPTVPSGRDGESLSAYVARLWPVLAMPDTSDPRWSTLLTLPGPIVVPGGRFREAYYWDSYFVMLGLEASGERRLAAATLAAMESLIDRYGHVPNGTRTYYLSRSQPPFFSLMVDLAAANGGGEAAYRRALPELLAEWRYWMRGADGLAPGGASLAAVRLADGTVLNRYYDTRDVPRDESYAEDVRTASASPDPSPLWREIRAAAASGWDYSSRWFADGHSLGSTRALAMLPVDLNALLVHLEDTIATASALSGDAKTAAAFRARATARAEAIRRLMFDPASGAFLDYLWKERTRAPALTVATVVPLALGVASDDEAAAVERTVAAKLLDPGGLETTLVDSGQQWDRPNGWAPMQWLAVVGFRRYGADALARDVASRWVAKTIAGYRMAGVLFEKYDVRTTGGDAGGGGEYQTQIGFGWTNGVLLALGGLYPDLAASIRAAVPDRSATIGPAGR